MRSNARVGLAALRCPEPPQAFAFGSRCAPIALPLVGRLQPGKLLGIHGLEVGCPELAVGWRLRRELRVPGLADPRLRWCDSTGLGWSGSTQWRCRRTRRPIRMAGAACNRHREEQGREGQELQGERQKRAARTGRSICRRGTRVTYANVGQVGRLSQAAPFAAREAHGNSAWPPSQT
jgi:hypothetical protein